MYVNTEEVTYAHIIRNNISILQISHTFQKTIIFSLSRRQDKQKFHFVIPQHLIILSTLAVYDYMKMQNRSYSVTDVVANLYNKHNKTEIQKAMDQLVTNGKLFEKVFSCKLNFHGFNFPKLKIANTLTFF